MTALLWLALALFHAAGQTPATDARPDTAVIRGRVTDKESGAPIARAVVHLSRRDGRRQEAARTDADGRYEFAGLPAGQYSGLVMLGEHRGTHLMETLASADRRGPIVLKEGEVRNDIDVALARSLAITVRVVDEWGEPLAGLSISIKSAATGRNEAPPANRRTDDRGRLRLNQLSAGRYIVCAEPSSPFSWYRTESPRRERFLRTCYPSAATDAQAERVRLEKSDVDGIEIHMRRGGTYAISGIVVDGAGAAPQNPSVSLTTFQVNGSSSGSVKVEPDGRFTIANLEPGDYAVEARIGGPDRPEQRQVLEIGFVPVVVESSDLEGVVVTMAKSVEVAGRFALEDATAPFLQPDGSRLYVSARLAGDRLRGQGSMVSATVDDRTFVFTRIFGKRMLDVTNIPRGWYVKSIRYGGKEIIDAATEFKAGNDPSALEILLSNRGATITGRVTDDRGSPVSGARVLVLPANPERWSRFPSYFTTPSTGAFRTGPHRAGDYLVVALSPSSPLPFGDRERLMQVAQAGEPITLGDSEERTLDLTVVRIDQ